ncbi:NAD(P)H-hydrate dehydratase [Polynucleobacter victoriensis]|uniref:ADP-dependent (S)-NAD(P)H-hydrate dehydratase n=1 Tax=Polynucleobacter victoriensis TaxID=2049319 RepID=A0A212U2U9_9BURK|nr:NAD(P)H-hydrate dehydratase [Polynucleobacter victoriensis]SNC72587.1 yjeF C-terminal region, hydroxyethylthiazole kinase-related [Polynucleobacter victoriensis]
MTAQTLNTFHLIPRLERQAHEHKGHAGKVLMIGGAPGMAGAILLAGRAALHAGAGWVILDFVDERAISVLSDQPELMLRVAQVGDVAQIHPDVIAIGPGLGQGNLVKQLLSEALQSSALLVIDADALNLIATNPHLLSQLKARSSLSTVLTPHPGEAANLLKETTEQIQSNRELAIQKLVDLTGSIVVLKGQHTLLHAPEQSMQVCLRGNPGMGVGGMGDVLTGVTSAILAQGIRHGLNAYEAACLAVELHSVAADNLLNQGVGPIGLTPSEVLLEVRNLINIK